MLLLYQPTEEGTFYISKKSCVPESYQMLQTVSVAALLGSVIPILQMRQRRREEVKMILVAVMEETCYYLRRQQDICTLQSRN